MKIISIIFSFFLLVCLESDAQDSLWYNKYRHLYALKIGDTIILEGVHRKTEFSSDKLIRQNDSLFISEKIGIITGKSNWYFQFKNTEKVFNNNNRRVKLIYATTPIREQYKYFLNRRDFYLKR